jgi:uncharacterized protein (DUF433 family)
MAEPTAAAPWTVTLAWAPDQNFGRVSTLNHRVPLFAIVAAIRAGDLLDEIADDYDLTTEQVEVLARLAAEAQEDWT